MAPGARGDEWRNWARNVDATPVSWHSPASSEEVAQVVRASKALGDRLKVVGSGHSCSPIASPDGARLMSLERLEGLIAAEPGSGLVTFGGGTTLASVNEAVAARGLALPSLGSISAQTLAGAISTGTHGSSLRHGGLAEQVESLELVASDGETHVASSEGDRELFDAARVGLGALGVITRVSLRCVKAFELVTRAEPVTFDDAVAGLGRLARENEYARVWWFPHTGWAQSWVAERTSTPVASDGMSSSGSTGAGNAAGERLMELLYGIARPVHSMVPTANRLLQQALYSGPSRIAGRSDRVFNFPIRTRQRVMEHAVPLEKATEAVVALRDLIDRRGFKAHLPVEIRFSAPESPWLSLARGRATCYIGVIAYRPYGSEPKYEPYFRAVDELMSDFEGRPHWGKIHYRGQAQLATLYPEWDRFLTLRERLDPDRMFSNPYLDSVLGGRR